MTLTHSGASELSQLMEGTTAGALIPEIVRRGFQDLLEAEWGSPDSVDIDQGFTWVSVGATMNRCSWSIGLM